ncbi:hypothetical protein A2803_04400 [Candidatus Woesebacteria bacterium RIFCSPHIGHO2_01_FULL_44_21]|uniref:Uncharacterized protein n=1 Tax=Candidatus Woesebacteria bacterium RIFCSPHIGHO2_01_FULL_44_21 TaxID=1802503 RepID=A0A1F7Z1N4_9BACT|nr:MAG: hypothetical protein A2803_04400 [Candidatus Woesebacteria bacterium RIFCSPHIGHO2_01_FULL_44_21]
MENVQTLLTIVVIALTVLLIVIGVQIFLVIKDLRRIMRRVNAMLEDSIIGGGLLRPDKLTGILEMFRRKKNVHTHGEGESPLN